MAADKNEPLGDLDLTPDRPRVTNPDKTRVKRADLESVPQVHVESRENMGSMLDIDIECLNKNFKYRFVNEAPLKVARAKAKGYRFVSPDEERIVNSVGDAIEPSEDGLIRVGDLILMKSPRPLYRARQAKKRERTKARLSGQKRKFKRDAQAAGVQRYGVPVEVITSKEPAGSKE